MNRVSFSEAVSDAWSRTKSLLFRPFNIESWLAIGFCAWLAGLGEQGAGFSVPNIPSSSTEHSSQDISMTCERALDFFSEHAYVIMAVIMVAVFVFGMIYTVVAWLNARGKFMLLDNVLTGEARVKAPWHAYRALGWSYFWWRVIYESIMFALLMLFFFAGGILVYACVAQESVMNIAGASLLVLGVVFVFFLLAISFIGMLLNDFVAPLMLMRSCRAVAAWREMMGLLSGNFGAFIAYAILKALLVFGLAMAFLVVLILTCCLFCVGGMLLALPYLNTVVLLPYHVFMRYLSLSYLSGFGDEFDAYRLGSRVE